MRATYYPEIFFAVMISITIVLLMFIFSIMLVGCGGENGDNIEDATYKIKYEVTGNLASVDEITYHNETGGDSQVNDVLIPWEYVFITSGKYLYTLQAMEWYDDNEEGRSIQLTVNIYKDGNLIDTMRSDTRDTAGPYVVGWIGL